MSNSLVEVSNNQIVADSRWVAEVSGKEHKDFFEGQAQRRPAAFQALPASDGCGRTEGSH
ncbi:hypothetical protein [Selenomonas sp. GACV-9]|uniref:hypothetical protein n=1 Tax=Selenomonas sp. GACV-9 TaxID=3158782 RepID=UPI0011608180